MKRKGKLPFDPKVFLSKANGGRAISDYGKDQIVYSQGEPADSVSTFRAARSRRPLSPSRGRKPWSRFWRPAISLGRVLDGTTAASGNSLRTVTECVIVRITKADITRVIHEEPAFTE